MQGSAGERKANRLESERSLYLQQHATNPVDWFPWGEEAFQKAKEQDKPVFLSIGYSTCHWCHVMEHESFEDEMVASVLNDACICIKVDREELPQVDTMYMQAASVLGSHSLGWPLNLFLDGDRRPFFAITYLPKLPRDGLPGFIQIINNIKKLWQSDQRESLLQHAGKVQKTLEMISDDAISDDERLLHERVPGSIDLFFQLADSVHGGFVGAPKFPLSYQLLFLMEYGLISRDERAIFFVEKTLKGMTRGGMWDRLGGGFCRYSVDDAWVVPHFEKMLYDNALLALTYSKACFALKNESDGVIAQKIFEYLLRDMQDQDGCFYAAQDADTNGIEGITYTWTPEEIIEVLGPSDGEQACDYFEVSEFGLCEEGRSPLQMGDSALLASKYGDSEEVFATKISEWETKLFQARQKRPQPHIDEKCVIAWNGLVLWALSEGFVVFKNEAYLKSATKLARRILTESNPTRLARVLGEDFKRHPAILDDYAYFIRGLLALFQATGKIEWLMAAQRLQDQQDELFWTERGYSQCKQGDVGLQTQPVLLHDGAEPSANGIALFNLQLLATLTTRSEYSHKRHILASRYSYYAKKSPLSCTSALLSSIVCSPSTLHLLIIVADSKDEKNHFQNLLNNTYNPREFHVVLEKSDVEFAKIYIPYLEFVKESPVLFYCTPTGCTEPVVGRNAISAYLATRST